MKILLISSRNGGQHAGEGSESVKLVIGRPCVHLHRFYNGVPTTLL